MRIWNLALWIAALLIPALAQADRVELAAGGGKGGDGAKATEARLVEPFAVGFDGSGNGYIVEMEGGERLFRVTPSGILSTVAGTGEKGFSGDGGPASKAQINGSHHLLVLPDGDILLADTFNQRVRRIDHRSKIITTIAGTGEKGFSGDGGPASKAQFGGIYCLALSPKADRLYLCDLDNRRIRVMDRNTGIVTTVAGNGEKGVPQDGQEALKAPLTIPRAIAVDSHGNLYILERGGNALRVVNPEGRIRTALGSPASRPSAEIGQMNGPKHLCVDRQDNVYIADTENHRILKYSPRTGIVEQVAGTGKMAPEGMPATEGVGGPAAKLRLNRPHGVTVHRDGSLYIADSSNNRVLRVRP